jgi:Fe2+ or Zn2+ uptake regulation protein
MRSPDELTETFRRHGRKVTAQRQCVFRVLHGNVDHPTAEAVYEVARAEMPTLSLKTVYQTLRELAELGEIAPLDLGTGAARFDPNVEVPHHHLVCAECGRVRDLEADLGRIRVPASRAQGFEVASTEVIFRGRCPECRTAAVAG